MRTLLRFLGALDVVAGALALAAASWLGDQLDLGTTTVRIGAVVLALVGVDMIAMAARPFMARAAIVIEALGALLALDLLLLGDPTGTGTAILVATALASAVAAVEVARLIRSSASGELDRGDDGVQHREVLRFQ